MEKKSNLNKFITLLEKDFYRSIKTVLPIILMFFIAHIVVICFQISEIQSLLDKVNVNKLIGENFVFIEKFGIDYLLYASGVNMIMLLSILILSLYTMLLWNREWMGNSKSIYTLLSLPIKKGYIILSKLVTVIVFIGFNVLVQILTLFLDKLILKLSINEVFFSDESVLGVFSTFNDSSWINLLSKEIWASLITIIALILIFGLVILLFRSFRLKGLILGLVLPIVYGVIYIGVYNVFHLYWDEYFVFRTIFSLITAILVYGLSKYLLEKKVTV